MQMSYFYLYTRMVQSQWFKYVCKYLDCFAESQLFYTFARGWGRKLLSTYIHI